MQAESGHVSALVPIHQSPDFATDSSVGGRQERRDASSVDRRPSEGQELEVSDHYKGAAGAHYVNMRQRDQSHIGHTLEFEYFEPFLKNTDCALDFGCGNGGMLRLMAQHVRRVVGIEVNASAADVARSSGLTVYSSLEALPHDELYDVVVSNHVLEHIRNVPATLEHIKKRIKNQDLFF